MRRMLQLRRVKRKRKRKRRVWGKMKSGLGVLILSVLPTC